MKAAMNGALHLSTLEGWWQEGYNGKNGWAITAGALYEKPQLQDLADAGQLYDLLEHEIAILYYERNEARVPQDWVRMMKESLFSVCQNFNVNRMLSDYLKKCYLPSIQYSEHILQDDYKALKQAVRQEKDVLKYWDEVTIKSMSTSIDNKHRLTEGQSVEVECSIEFGQAPAELFCVELFYMLSSDNRFKIIPMRLQSRDNTLSDYRCSFAIEGYGPQSINVRIRPAEKIVQDLHPELIKWKE
jgi:starch phosphorylase